MKKIILAVLVALLIMIVFADDPPVKRAIAKVQINANFVKWEVRRHLANIIYDKYSDQEFQAAEKYVNEYTIEYMYQDDMFKTMQMIKKDVACIKKIEQEYSLLTTYAKQFTVLRARCLTN